ncbi:MAG TPA: hypothetical protein PK507_05075, partial [bacterium]|nr:hypothetical protein [bacterium]
MTLLDIAKVFSLSFVAFIMGMLLSPLLLKLLTKFKMGKQIREESTAPVFVSMHKSKSGTLTGAGIL